MTVQIPRPHHAGSIFKRRHSQFASNQVDQIGPNRKLNAHSINLKKKQNKKKNTAHLYYDGWLTMCLLSDDKQFLRELVVLL